MPKKGREFMNKKIFITVQNHKKKNCKMSKGGFNLNVIYV